jgi:hypothetical protein
MGAGSEMVAGEIDCRGREGGNMNRCNDVFWWGREKVLNYIQLTHLIKF